jgi:hypothetical protein
VNPVLFERGAVSAAFTAAHTTPAMPPAEPPGRKPEPLDNDDSKEDSICAAIRAGRMAADPTPEREFGVQHWHRA